MLAADGRVHLIAELESAARESAKGDSKSKKQAKPGKGVSLVDADHEKWLARDWLVKWLNIAPPLNDVDLRPYVFVARDKRVLATAPEASGLESLIESLSGGELAARLVESRVASLSASDAEQVFNALRERVLRTSSFATEPAGFAGLMLVAKHHPRHQSELLALTESIEAQNLGAWVTRGWNDTLTEPGASEQLRTLLGKWAAQDENHLLKRSATQALAPFRRAGH
jgi:hypothetical protein